MKKMLAIVMSILIVGMVVAGCGQKTPTTSGFEIALITDKGNIDDKSFNQGAWEGVVKFAEEGQDQPTSTTNRRRHPMQDILQR